MNTLIEEKVEKLTSNFHLLRTKEGSDEFDKIWEDITTSLSVEERREAGRLIRDKMKSVRNNCKNKRTDVTIKECLGEIGDVLSMSYIAQHYFQRDRSWLAQRVNGNIVNGKPCAFTDAELDIFKFALNDIKNKLSEIILSIK
jgi:hypothetical protein